GYRNGEPFGEPVRKAGLQPYEPGKSQVLLGLRHGTDPVGNRPLRGRILEARLYDRELTPEEARA
ncbi:MAG: hypothetical protein KDN18_06120, partial [Verrucomicrobiae bacterium]|nr:hypothetical protein [Verrucomicrobiae bacterium]